MRNQLRMPGNSPRLISTVAILATALIAPSPATAQKPSELAREAKINQSAPVIAAAEILVNAPPQRVWNLLTDIAHWPTWQPDISESAISGPLTPGTVFTWSTSTEIRSRLELVEPNKRLAWTGKAWTATAIHVWELLPQPGGRTLVRTRESMDGFLLSLFFSSEKLQASDQQWLNALKTAAEK